MVAQADTLLQLPCDTQDMRPGHCTRHADSGRRVTSLPMALWLTDLGVTKAPSRPRVSHEHPDAEALCNTLKYRTIFQERFDRLEAARALCQPCLGWYNTEHRHADIGRITSVKSHDRRAPQIKDERADTWHAAFATHPERLTGKTPAPRPLPEAVWMNWPTNVPQGAEAESMATLP